MIETTVIQTIAGSLLQALDDGKLLSPLSRSYPALSSEEAYSIQFALRSLKIKRGERSIGWKVGATNPAVMAQISWNEPILGHLTSASLYPPEAEVIPWGRLIQPGIEPEIAFRLKKDLRGPGITAQRVAEATDLIFPAVEIIDSRIQGWGGKIQDMIADNVMHQGIMLGKRGFPLDEIDLPGEKVAVDINGKLAAGGLGSDVLQNPVNVVVWLANKLAEFGHSLRRGDLLMTGSLTQFLLVNRGDRIKMSYGRLGTLEFSFN